MTLPITGSNSLTGITFPKPGVGLRNAVFGTTSKDPAKIRAARTQDLQKRIDSAMHTALDNGRKCKRLTLPSGQETITGFWAPLPNTNLLLGTVRGRPTALRFQVLDKSQQNTVHTVHTEALRHLLPFDQCETQETRGLFARNADGQRKSYPSAQIHKFIQAIVTASLEEEGIIPASDRPVELQSVQSGAPQQPTTP